MIHSLQRGNIREVTVWWKKIEWKACVAKGRSPVYSAIFLLILFFILTGVEGAYAGPRDISLHYDPIRGAMRDPSVPRGGCAQCHKFASGKLPEKGSLWTKNDNGLCYTCHSKWSSTGIYPGPQEYDLSTHSRDPRMVWNGPVPPRRKEMDAPGKCVNCHDPHGVKDGTGMIPDLIYLRDKDLCLSCHNGSQAVRNIAIEFRKPYRHPVGKYTLRHDPKEGIDPSRYGVSNRHVTCSDCHNPHALQADPSPPVAPSVSHRNIRVGAVRVTNGPAGTIPSYTYRSPLDRSTPLAEYEICFKCHSSFTTQPPGQVDLARYLNTNNPSFHPVEGVGKDPLIPAGAFVSGWNAGKMTYCGDCHGSDNAGVKGPHGSIYPKLLKANYPESSQPRRMDRQELCFRCHNFEVYGNPLSPSSVLGNSRWNPPGEISGHAFHVGTKNVPCYSCHDSHGSLSHKALVRTGRMPGLLSFSQNGSGGNCAATCHAPKTYSINYSR